MKRLKYVMLGALTYIPGLHSLLRRGTGGTISARYCYSAWLRHAVFAARHGKLKTAGVVAEIGPGDSLGIGLSALLSGFDRFYAFDRVAHAAAEKNLVVFDELLGMFRARARIPDDTEFPEMRPKLDTYDFPHDVFSRLDTSLVPARTDGIRRDLQGLSGAVRYVAPWEESDVVPDASVDFIISQAVLEHIDDLFPAYKTMARYLRVGGLMSHQIDFKSHGTADKWNGHLAYSRATWSAMRGRLPYLLNRLTYSSHRRMWDELGLEVLTEQLHERVDGIPRKDLAREFSDLPDGDLRVAGAFVQLRKPGS
jgi:hypothetical protein